MKMKTKYQSLTEDDSIVTPINVRMKNTDIQLMDDFREFMMDNGGFNKPITEEGKTLIMKMNSFLSDVSWNNRDKNPYKEVK